MNEISPSIRRLCRFIRFGSTIFVVGVVLIYLITWCWPIVHADSHPVMLRLHLAGLSADALRDLTIGDRLLIGAISLPYLAALTWAFYQLNCMLRGFERGDYFESVTVGHLRAFAGYLLLAKVLSLLAMHARVGALVHLLGHQNVRTLINLSSDDMAVLLMCALFFLIARMMEEGRRLAEENRGFV